MSNNNENSQNSEGTGFQDNNEIPEILKSDDINAKLGEILQILNLIQDNDLTSKSLDLYKSKFNFNDPGSLYIKFVLFEISKALDILGLTDKKDILVKWLGTDYKKIENSKDAGIIDLQVIKFVSILQKKGATESDLKKGVMGLLNDIKTEIKKTVYYNIDEKVASENLKYITPKIQKMSDQQVANYDNTSDISKPPVNNTISKQSPISIDNEFGKRVINILFKLFNEKDSNVGEIGLGNLLQEFEDKLNDYSILQSKDLLSVLVLIREDSFPNIKDENKIKEILIRVNTLRKNLESKSNIGIIEEEPIEKEPMKGDVSIKENLEDGKSPELGHLKPEKVKKKIEPVKEKNQELIIEKQDTKDTLPIKPELVVLKAGAKKIKMKEEQEASIMPEESTNVNIKTKVIKPFNPEIGKIIKNSNQIADLDDFSKQEAIAILEKYKEKDSKSYTLDFWKSDEAYVLTVAIQNLLGVEIDGLIGGEGSKTRKKIKEFQKANGIKGDGVIGPKTIKKLSILI